MMQFGEYDLMIYHIERFFKSKNNQINLSSFKEFILSTRYIKAMFGAMF